MSALGQLLLLMGKQVSGSDLSSSAATRSLAEAGADIHLGHAAEYVDGRDARDPLGGSADRQPGDRRGACGAASRA